MRLAIMQPYLFPYPGYYQLLDKSDVFVIYDDVQYIRRGWINRNRLWVNGSGEYMFTLPVRKAPRETPIHAIELSDFPGWRSTFLKTLKMAYGQADHFTWAFGLIRDILKQDRQRLISLLSDSISICREAFGIETTLLSSSRLFRNDHLDGMDRILDICSKLQARKYLNLPGGRHLYVASAFASRGIELAYLSPGVPQPAGPGRDRNAVLSIIDLMMWRGRAGVRHMLPQCSIIKARSEREIESEDKTPLSASAAGQRETAI